MRVVLEVGTKRTFASALDWPGFGRSARDPDGALAALVVYGPRYRKAVRDKTFQPPDGVDSFDVVEQVKGDTTTDFGAPGAPAALEGDLPGADELERLITLLKGCWRSFDRTAEAAVGAELAKGPRGGGRELEAIVDHVYDADRAYLRSIGGTFKPPPGAAAAERAEALRADFIETLRARGRGEPPPPNPRRKAALWPVRYAIRRSAWHALDHAWEIEDRARR